MTFNQLQAKGHLKFFVKNKVKPDRGLIPSANPKIDP